MEYIYLVMFYHYSDSEPQAAFTRKYEAIEYLQGLKDTTHLHLVTFRDGEKIKEATAKEALKET